ncbi:MAG TPA: PilN domain-containing protein [Tepidisphaeraceae bacterium]|nr:PilN domain-containing protein [Tepidisphaeraceae bacterium]
MNRANLIPLARQLRDQRAARLRRWAWIIGGLCCLILATLAYFAAGNSLAGGPPPQEFSKAAAELSKANQQAASLRASLATEKQRLRSRQLIFRQPDYSLLLRLIAQQVDEDVVLSRCEFGRASDFDRASEFGRARGAAPLSRTPSDALQLSGFARSQPAVAAFMLQLESTGIFQKVTLVRSNEQPLLSGEVAAFEILCVPGASPKGAQ